RVAGHIKGIGLGLAQVARVARIHEGSVYARNREQGALVGIRLPVHFVDKDE
ncbi:MAG: two-component sensor histidine kinase, partial [Gammaproteobacteria bacterium]